MRNAVSTAALLLAITAPTPAQVGLSGEGEATLEIGALDVPPLDVDAWVEVTPLAGEGDVAWIELPPVAPEASPRTLRLSREGRAMLCSGSASHAVRCTEIYVDPDVDDTSAGRLLAFVEGVSVRGGYRLDGLPVVGARVAVVPQGLEASRPFTLPLGAVDGSPFREILTDEDGVFRLPALAEGEYFLETLLPSGRVHRSDPFEVPPADDLRAFFGPAQEEPLAFELGELDVREGLAITFRVTDVDGAPLAAAIVSARQGDTPASLVGFQREVDADGLAELSGFAIERPVEVVCRAPGHHPFSAAFELLPVRVDCALERLASIAGEIYSWSGEPLDATVSVGASSLTVSAVAGLFLLDGLAAGSHLVTVAAPGHRAVEVEVEVVAGEERELVPLTLAPAPEVVARILDALDGEPIVGVEVVALDPAGALTARTDATGEVRFAAAAARPLTIELRHDEYAWARLSVDPDVPDADDGDEAKTWNMTPGGFVRVVVLDGQDRPCRSCPVRIGRGGEELLTNAAGEALSRPLAPATYRVERPRLVHFGSSVVELEGAETRFARVAAGEVSTVRLGGARQRVRVSFRPSVGAASTLAARSPTRRELYSAEADGSFEVGLRGSAPLDLYLGFAEPEAGTAGEVWVATLEGVDSDALRLELSTASVEGVVTVDREPVRGLPVRLVALADRAIAATVHCGADGRFVIPYAPPGVYALAAGGRNVQMLAISPGRRHRVRQIDVPEAAYLRR